MLKVHLADVAEVDVGDEVAAEISSSVGALPVATKAIIFDICFPWQLRQS